MTSNRFTLSSKAPGKSFFTMVELIAVISITAILLTITIRIMKTDSTKANAQVIGGAINYAQSYAMANLSTSKDNDSDGFLDEYIMVIVDSSSNTLTIKKFDSDNSSIDETISEENLVNGSTIDNDYFIGFGPKGDPLEDTNPPATPTDVPSDNPTALVKQEIITINDNKDVNVSQIIKIKPFTGKVTYY